MRKPTIILLCVCYLLNISYSLHAETKKPLWYQVEAVLFTQEEQNNTMATESWHKKPSILWPSEMIVLKWPLANNYSEQDTERLAEELQLQPARQHINNQPHHEVTNEPFTLLPSENLHLNALAFRIKQSQNLRLLGHIGWRQPIDDKELMKPIFIQAGNKYGLESELEGTIQLIRSNHLHIKAQLLFSTFKSLHFINKGIDWSIFNSPEHQTKEILNSNKWKELQYQPANNHDTNHNYVKTRIVSIDSSERIFLGKIIYFDHPLFGLAVKVSSFDPTLAATSLNEKNQPKVN